MITLADSDQFTQLTNGSASTDANARVKFLKSIYDDRQEIAFILEITTGSVAPGANRTATFYFATPDAENYTPAQLSTMAEQYVLNLPATANTKRLYAVPNVRCIQPFVHSWFDYGARDAGSSIEVKRRLFSNPNR